jgi:glycogen debranching enzyme
MGSMTVADTPLSMNLLRNMIDITRVPFSDRGSRLLVFKDPARSCLYVKLAERLASLEPGLEAYLRRPPFIQDLLLIDEHGQPLEFEVVSSPHVLYLNTRLGEFGLVFQDRQTISFGLPPGVTAGLRFYVLPQYFREDEIGGVLKSIRNLAYSTEAEIVKNLISPRGGGYTVEFVVQAGDDSAITVNIRSVHELNREVLPFTVAHEKAETRWREWFSRVPPVAEKYRRTYAYAWWIMANNLISPLGRITHEAMIPSNLNYIGLWLWDSALHALAFRHVDADLARNQIRAILTQQLPNGMLPDAIHDEGVVIEITHPIAAQVTKPPILAWAALKLHEMDPDLGFLQEIYVSLVRLNQWWSTMNDDDTDGLVQYNHPYSSGADDNPLWSYGMPVEAPDINTYLCVQMGSLAVMAELLGMENEGQMWRRRASALVRRMIEDMWDEEKGIFQTLLDEKPVPVLTPFALYPLWTGQLPKEIRDRLIAHLTNPKEFWGEFVIPTVARNDPHYNPDKMWSGPVWVNINYFFIEALDQVGEHALADELREKTLELVMRHPSIFEYYSADTAEPPHTAADVFGWTAAVFIDLAIQASHHEPPSHTEQI